MIRPVAALTLVLVLAACGGVRESKLNPFNWFGRSEVRERVVLPVKPADQRPLVQTVTAMDIEALRTGALVKATGLSPTQGYWAAELKAQPVTEAGLLVLEFKILPPLERHPAGTEATRQVTAAIHLSNVKLSGVREIVVQGQSNARSVRR